MNRKTIRYFEQFLVQANFKDIFKLQWKNRWLCNECVNRNEYFFLISTAFLPLNIFILLPFFLYSNFFFYFYFSLEIFCNRLFFYFCRLCFTLRFLLFCIRLFFRLLLTLFFFAHHKFNLFKSFVEHFFFGRKRSNPFHFLFFFCVKNEFSTKFYLLYLKYMRMKEYKLGGSQSETEAPEIIE